MQWTIWSQCQISKDANKLASGIRGAVYLAITGTGANILQSKFNEKVKIREAFIKKKEKSVTFFTLGSDPESLTKNQKKGF